MSYSRLFSSSAWRRIAGVSCFHASCFSTNAKAALGGCRFLVPLLTAIMSSAGALKVTTQNNETKLELTFTDCRKLVVGHESSDVDTNYHPGVDAEGRVVAPADLNSVDLGDPLKNFSIPFRIDLDDLLTNSKTNQLKNRNTNKHHRDGIDASEAKVAQIDFGPDNRLRINGKYVGDKTQDMIAKRCRAKFPNL